MGPKKQDETPRHFKRRVYGALRNMAKMATPPREVRVTQIQPELEWENVWNNLHSIPKSEGHKSAWYTVIHDLLPTNTRLHRIRLVETEDCRGRNVEMDPYTASGNTQNGAETHPPWLTPGTKFPLLATTTTFGDTVDPGESRILPNAESEKSVAR